MIMGGRVDKTWLCQSHSKKGFDIELMVYSFSCFAWNLMVREMQRCHAKSYSIKRTASKNDPLEQLCCSQIFNDHCCIIVIYLISVVLNPDWCRVRFLPPNHNVELDVAHCPTQGVSVSTALSAISCRSTVLSVAWGPSDWGLWDAI